MIRTQVYLPDDVYRDLKLIAEAEQVKVSHLIRQGAAKIIKARTKPRKDEWEDFIGSIKGGPKDLSQRINDIYK